MGVTNLHKFLLCPAAIAAIGLFTGCRTQSPKSQSSAAAAQDCGTPDQQFPSGVVQVITPEFLESHTPEPASENSAMAWFHCKEEANKKWSQAAPLILLVGDFADPFHQQLPEQTILGSLGSSYPNALVLDLRARCVPEKDMSCFDKVLEREPGLGLTLVPSARHSQAKKSSLIVLNTYVQRFAERAQGLLQHWYPTLRTRKPSQNLALADLSPEERLLGDMEANEFLLERILEPLAASETPGALPRDLLFVGIGSGNDPIASFLRQRPEIIAKLQAQKFKPKALQIDPPGWLGSGDSVTIQAEALQAPLAGVPQLMVQGTLLGANFPGVKVSLNQGVRYSSQSFMQYVFSMRLFLEDLANSHLLWDSAVVSYWPEILQVLANENPSPSNQGVSFPAMYPIRQNEWRAGVDDKDALSLPLVRDLSGTLAFDIHLDPDWSEHALAGQEHALVAVGGCEPMEQASPLRPRLWLEKKTNGWNFVFGLRYQEETHFLSWPISPAQLPPGQWRKMILEWKLPTQSQLPEIVPIASLNQLLAGKSGEHARGNNGAQQNAVALSMQEMMNFAWVVAPELSSSFQTQAGNGKMALILENEELAAGDIRRGGKQTFFRPCTLLDPAAEKLQAFRQFPEHSQWNLITGPVCKGPSLQAKIPLAVGCQLKQAYFSIRNVNFY